MGMQCTVPQRPRVGEGDSENWGDRASVSPLQVESDTPFQGKALEVATVRPMAYTHTALRLRLSAPC